jgi:hypothetical protein
MALEGVGVEEISMQQVDVIAIAPAVELADQAMCPSSLPNKSITIDG